jgi:Putative heavy-metal chelation
VSIVDEWTRDLRDELRSEPSTAAEVRIGIFYTGVRLASGEVGVAFSPARGT